jgi:hypothetical protein
MLGASLICFSRFLCQSRQLLLLISISFSGVRKKWGKKGLPLRPPPLSSPRSGGTGDFGIVSVFVSKKTINIQQWPEPRATVGIRVFAS